MTTRCEKSSPVRPNVSASVGLVGRRGARLRIGVLAAALAVTVAGCGGGSDLTAQQWTDQMCGAVFPFVQTVTHPPAPARNPATTARDLTGYVERSTGTLDGTLDSLDRLGPAPVDDGQAVADQLRDSLTGIRAAYAESQKRLNALPTGDPAALTRQLPVALEPVSRLQGNTRLLAGVTGNPELAAAVGASAACRRLGTVSQPAGAAPTPAGGTPGKPEGEGGGN